MLLTGFEWLAGYFISFYNLHEIESCSSIVQNHIGIWYVIVISLYILQKLNEYLVYLWWLLECL